MDLKTIKETAQEISRSSEPLNDFSIKLFEAQERLLPLKNKRGRNFAFSSETKTYYVLQDDCNFSFFSSPPSPPFLPLPRKLFITKLH